MPTYDRSKMCSECPFRANALKGWLGPWTIEDFEQFIHGEGHFICHTEVNDLLRKGMETDEINEEGQHCVGMLRYMKSVCKLPHDAEKVEAMKRLKDIPDQPIIAPFKFREHHSGSPFDMPKKGRAKTKKC